MSRRDDRTRLELMRDHAREAMTLAAASSREELDSNRMLSLALVQLEQIVGEAAARVSEPCQLANPQIPWP